MRKKRGKIQKEFFNKQVKKTLPFQLLIIFLIIFVGLILIWIVLFILGKVTYFPQEESLEGALGTLIWGAEGAFLEVLNYNISEDNQTIQINVNWSFESGDLRRILIGFEAPIECNYTNSSVPNFQENKTYIIDYTTTSCNLNFENITSISNLSIYSQENIPLVQTDLIPSKTIYNDDSLVDIFNLNLYFSCLGDINFGFVGDPLEKTGFEINSTNNVNLDPKVEWYGTYWFNLTASCDGDVLNVSTSGENMSFYITAIDDVRVSVNNAPEFLEDDCGDLQWYVNTNYHLEMDDCFEDDDDDSLNFSYKNVSGHNDNLFIKADGESLTLIPDSDWDGRGYFYIYADDSIEKTGGKVNFEIKKNTSTINPSPTNNNPKIKSSDPSGLIISIFPNKTKSFSINAENYEIIKWYLDGNLIKSGGLSYSFNGGVKGSHTIKVEVINGTVQDSKVWNLIIEEEIIEEGVFEFGKVIFYLIIVILIILIFLVVWLFIAEKNSRKRKINYMGFGLSTSKSTSKRKRTVSSNPYFRVF